MTQIATTVVVLKAAASAVGLTGISKLKKAELEEAVLTRRDGRKAVYQVLDARFAEETVQKTLVEGAFFMPRPEEIPEPTLLDVIGPKVGDLSDIRKLKNEQNRVFKANAHAKAGFIGKIRAIKEYIRANELRNVRWHEDERGFSLGVQRQAKAA